ncbi:hypothetical protein FQV27_13250 [Paracoccus aurantiacus]|uniref:HdeA/HdeB family protein n=1 Tax=Paracoccus aurantiacus TaxID=2599412 RepID=A0A5C6RZY2_9RHOB|nr:hypothetical protein [Paracoccus aurantiacus]TXB68146.1 hypothetical protein FQV27_13250 [Paracoccus aurantiacus]
MTVKVMHKMTAICAAIAAFAGPCNAQESAKGIGALDCATFWEGRHDPLVQKEIASWAYGYFTAMNMVRAQATKQPMRDLAGLATQPSALFADTVAACQAEPSELVLGHVLAFYNKLPLIEAPN